MKRILLLFFALMLLCPFGAGAENFVNLTPKPKQMTVGTGTLSLPTDFRVCVAGLPDSIKAEATNFVEFLNGKSGLKVKTTTKTSGAQIVLSRYAGTLDPEGYKLDITTSGVKLQSNTTAGFFYGLTTLKKLMPASVRAGVADVSLTTLPLPVVSITDSPRFGYRGFMLDVSRHFFDVDEIKKILNVMADYKLNRFHWHITDDQGWRLEIKKYPKLTTIGATRENSYLTDLKHGPYWTNKQDGPFFYTQEQVREVVAYAKARHIEILPEVDMPGHIVSALAAYPEFSCWPDGEHKIPLQGGVYTDILNVANPKAVQFAKDVMKEVMELFPFEMVSIGGDECPTNAWEQNAECKALYQREGLKSYRWLQSRFIKEMADFIKQHGHKTAVWNEAITAKDSELDSIKAAEVTVMCWHPAAASAIQAANMGLNNIVTFYGPYYINRKQSKAPDEPSGAGDGSDNLAATYNAEAAPNSLTAAQRKYYTGVQGSFWTEHVGTNDYLEYLALPRLLAIAEAGWTEPSAKNYNNFVRRIQADTTYLNLAGFTYCRRDLTTASATDMVLPRVSNDTVHHYYQLQTRATDASRQGRSIELLSSGSSLISTYAAKGAQANRLWTAPTAAKGDANYDYQLWAFEQSPTAPGKYALVCKAFPKGSLKQNPTQQSNTGRWDYDTNAKHYCFELGKAGYGKDGNSYYYTISSDQVGGWYLNASMPGQGLAVNLWTDAASGNGGLWKFVAVDAVQGMEALTDALSDASSLLNKVQTYAAKKETGKFSAAAKAALATGIAEVESELARGNTDVTALSKRLSDAVNALWASFGYLEEGQQYRIHNNVEAFSGLALADLNTDAYLRYSFLPTDTVGTKWQIVSSTINADHSQTVRLQNVTTGRWLLSASATNLGKIGYAVRMAPGRSAVTFTFNPATQDYQISMGGHNFYPIPQTSTALPGIIGAGSVLEHKPQPIRPQGAAWVIEQVDNNTTAINTPSVDNSERNTVYDLAGRRVQHPQKGLYIEGNKKTLHL